MQFWRWSLLFLISTWSLAQSEDLSKKLTDGLKGAPLTSKQLFAGGQVHFDHNGRIIGTVERCESWTLCRTFRVDGVSINAQGLEITTQRIAIGFADGIQTPHLIEGRNCTFKIDVPAPVDEQGALAAMKNVFLTKTDHPDLNLPFAWQKYFNQPKSAETAPVRPGGTQKVPAEVMAGKLTKKVMPKYPETAKNLRQQGTVILSGLIGKDGRVHDLWIVKPLGLGLDEAALEGVSQWEYQPTLLNGQPVEVETIINVNFQLER
jgi:TonB family protein